MTIQERILSRLPYSPPFLFADRINAVDTEQVAGTFYLDPGLDFYKGHFRDQPVTPGVILTEIMAQIGLVSLGIYLTLEEPVQQGFPFALSAAAVEFLKPVCPGETVTVHSRKIYFRFGKLKCKVSMHDTQGDLVCEGVLSGIIIKNHGERT